MMCSDFDQECRRFGPILDGDGGFMPRMPKDMRNDETYKHSYKNITVIVGINSDESTLFLAGGMIIL